MFKAWYLSVHVICNISAHVDKHSNSLAINIFHTIAIIVFHKEVVFLLHWSMAFLIPKHTQTISLVDIIYQIPQIYIWTCGPLYVRSVIRFDVLLIWWSVITQGFKNFNSTAREVMDNLKKIDSNYYPEVLSNNHVYNWFVDCCTFKLQ